jgi:hypothetical protein
MRPLFLTQFLSEFEKEKIESDVVCSIFPFLQENNCRKDEKERRKVYGHMS